MADTNREQPKPFRIAELTGVVKNPSNERKLFPEHQQDDIGVSWEGGRAILSTLLWERASWRHRLALIQAVLTTFDCTANTPTAQLCWGFSSKVVHRADAAKLSSQWIDEGAPPVMEVIEFVIEDIADGRSIRTVGLAAIFGHELDAVILSEADHGLAKMLAHLAQDILRNGPLDSSAAVGPDGQEYRLTMMPQNSGVGPTVRITII